MQNNKFLYILRTALDGRQTEDLSLSAEQAGEILRLAEIHNVLPLVFNAVHSSLTEDSTVLRQKIKLMVSQQVLRTEAFKELYTFLNKAGLEPIVVKGIICRSLYPNPDQRISSDEDLLIHPEEFEDYCNVLTSLGFTMKRKSENSHQTSFVRADGFYVELHTTLFDTNTDFFTPWNALFENAHFRGIYEKTDEISLLTLSHTDHLLYLILHALKHFIHSGVGIRQVCDISVFIHKNHPSIDFDYIFKKCEELGTLKFASDLLIICKNHLSEGSFPINIPIIDTTDDETDLLADILGAGIYGGSTESRRHSGSITFNAAKKQKKQWLIKRVLPGTKSLDRRYSYARRNPVLLPVAWGHRLINYRKETEKTENNSPKDAIRIGNNRIKLLKKYGLIQK